MFGLNRHFYKVVFSVTLINPCPSVNGKFVGGKKKQTNKQAEGSKLLSEVKQWGKQAPRLYPPSREQHLLLANVFTEGTLDYTLH